VRLRFSSAARADLDAIIDYLRTEHPAAADGVRRRIQAATRRLQRFPRLGPISAGTRLREVREILVNPYVIRYRVFDNEIIVIEVRHERRSG
jgi:plasmid stabilization system protein ParE